LRKKLENDLRYINMFHVKWKLLITLFGENKIHSNPSRFPFCFKNHSMLKRLYEK